MATAVVSGRVNEQVRQRADVAMREAGLTSSDVIQNVWASMAETGEVPEVAKRRQGEGRGQAALARLERFLDSLPPANPAYAGWDDDDILALRVLDYA